MRRPLRHPQAGQSARCPVMGKRDLRLSHGFQPRIGPRDDHHMGKITRQTDRGGAADAPAGARRQSNAPPGLIAASFRTPTPY